MNKIVILRISILLAVLGLGMSSCSDNPATPDDEEVEAVGLVLFDGEAEVLRAENGTVTGSIELQQGTLSPHYTLKFIDEKGNLFVIDEPDHTPGGEITDPTIAEIVRDEPGDWNFHIRGLKQGSTTLRLTVKHGGHDDFTSPLLPVTITP